MTTIKKGNQNYKVEIFVVVFNSFGDIVDEVCDMREAKKSYKGYTFKWAAAEQIDEDGNLNPNVYGATKQEAISNLRKSL